jgi:hypothetical protein
MAQDELTLLIQSRHPIVVVECDDEARLLAQLATSSAAARLPLFTWSVTDGIRRHGAPSPVYETEDPAKALAHIEAAAKPAVYAFRDLAPYLTDARLVRRLREVAQSAEASRATLVLSGPSIELPAELRPLAARWTLDLPAREELSELVLETFKELNRGNAYRYQFSREELDGFVGQLAA